MLILLPSSLPQRVAFSTDFGLGSGPDMAWGQGAAGRVGKFVSVPVYGEESAFKINSLKKK
jgi:hypothetical protein